MSKQLCQCGHTLSDVDQIHRDELFGIVVSFGEIFEEEEKLRMLIAGFCDAYKNGEHVAWLKINCPVSVDQDISGIIGDMITRITNEFGVRYARCTKCGTYMIQRSKDENYYLAYSPRSPDLNHET